MIRNFRHKCLRELYETGRSRQVRPDLIRRAVRRLEALSQAERPEDLNIPGFNFHRLSGPLAASFSLHLNGPWCITFEWRDGDAINVDLVNYH